MNYIAVDTETHGFDGPPWSVQYSLRPYHGRLILVEDAAKVEQLGRLLRHPATTTIVHNAVFDLGVLGKLGITPAHTLDTMVMAYLLGENSLKLKTLAYRYANLEMRSYASVVKPHEDRIARPWLESVLEREWPDPEPELQTQPDGSLHIKQPQNITKRLRRFLKNYDKGSAKQSLVEYWADSKRSVDRSMVEAVLGPMPRASLADVPFDDALRYGCEDAAATMAIFPPLYDRIIRLGLEPTLLRDMGILPMVMEMMQRGMRIDIPHFEALSEELDTLIYNLQEELNTVAGGYLNPNSPKEVLARLRMRGLRVKSTEAKELDQHKGDELVDTLQKLREMRKLKSTYVDVLPQVADTESRVHTTLSTTKTATGRLASGNPVNLQNQPVRSEYGRRIRYGFVAEEGHVLLAIDTSQIELRLSAHVSQDTNLLKAYRGGLDLHAMTAAAMFGIPLEDVDGRKHRRPGKTTNFSVIYGISPPALQMRFHHEGIRDFTVEDCARFIGTWKTEYPGFFDWVEETKDFMLRHGYVVDIFGRRRWMPEVYSDDTRIQEAGFREGCNAVIQSSAAGVIKEAMIQLTPAVAAWNACGIEVWSLLQVHDEVIFEVDEEWAEDAGREFGYIIENAVELSVPVLVGVKSGKRWGSMKELNL